MAISFDSVRHLAYLSPFILLRYVGRKCDSWEKSPGFYSQVWKKYVIGFYIINFTVAVTETVFLPDLI